MCHNHLKSEPQKQIRPSGDVREMRTHEAQQRARAIWLFQWFRPTLICFLILSSLCILLFLFVLLLAGSHMRSRSIPSDSYEFPRNS